MQIPRDLSRRMLEAVEQVPIVDVYERLIPESERVSQPVDFIAWLLAYAGVEMRALGVEGEELALLADVQAKPEERWSTLARYWPLVRTTVTGRTILRVAWELFGVEEIDERTWKDISARLWKMHEKGFYHRLLCERANIRMTLVDNPVDPDMSSCCAPVDSYDWLFEIRCRSNIEDLAQELGESPGAALEWLDVLVEKSVRRDADGGGIAFKLSALPDVAVPSSEEVEWALGRVSRRDDVDTPGELFPEMRGTGPRLGDEPALQSYLVNRFLTCVSQLGRPVLVRVGDGLTAERLGVLAHRYPEVRFVGIYAGGADPLSLRTLARALPNVTLAMGELWRTAPQVARQSLKGWLHGVPLNKLYAVSGGTTMVEAVCVQALIVREQIAALLAEMVAEGYLDEEDAYLAIEKLLYVNAWDYFALQ